MECIGPHSLKTASNAKENRMIRAIVCLLMGLTCLITVTAQESTRYFWETAGLYVAVPTGWASPVPLEQNGAPVLLLKPALTGAEAAGGMSVQLKRLPAQAEPVDLAALLKSEFEVLNLRLPVTQTMQWLDAVGLEGFGTDKDSLIYGRGRLIMQPDNQILVLMISGPLSTMDEINDTFLAMISGTSTSEIDPGPRPYGILWERTSTGADGNQAFIDPRALAMDGQTVYVADFLNGILAFEAHTGEFLWQQRVSAEAHITALAADATGTLYAADTGTCACVYRVTREAAQIIAQGFGPQGPGYLVADGEGHVFITDIGSEGHPFVHVFQDGIEQDPLLFEIPLLMTPWLIGSPNQTLLVVTDSGELMEPSGAGFTTIGSLTFAGGGRFVILGTLGMQDFVLLDETGTFFRVDVSGLSYPLGPSLSPDISLAGVSFLPDGTLYTLEKTATESRLVARSRTAIPYGTGTERLIPNRIVTWRAPQDTQHVWLIQGHASDVIDLTVFPIMPDPSLILAIQLIDEEGKVLGEQSITPLPQPPLPITLERDGLYFIVTTQVNAAAQSYQLGYSVPRPLLTGDQAITGTLSEAIPVQRWIIEAKAGQTLSARVIATSGTLDPSLRLVNPRGNEVQANEDADPALGLDAALSDVRLSNNGAYVLEVRATTGAGQYQLTLGIKD